MAAFPDIHVVRPQAASAPFQALLNGDRAPRPVLAARRIIAPDHRPACSWHPGTPNIDPLSG
jgi:hypothetical protein